MQQQLKKPSSILEYGLDFQRELIANIIVNRVFGVKIVEIIKPEYFKNQYFGFIIKLIQEYYKKHEVVPNYKGIQMQIDFQYLGVPETYKILTDTLNGIKETDFCNENLQENALRFCKYEAARNVLELANKKIISGNFNDYEELESMVKKGFEFKEDDESVAFATDIESALADDYRDPIATGVVGVDAITNGGLGRKELAVIIAPLGVGKTTILSVIGSNAYLAGNNVLHIFFEDQLNEVRRKYMSHWTGIALPELNSNRALVLDKVAEITARPNQIVFEKMRADETTVAKLRNVIKRERSKLGGKLDMVILDYADCIRGEQNKDSEEWTGEGRTMRQLEGIADEFNVAFWTAVQGGRKSISASVVESDMIGGNIKKAQVAHFIMSVAKTLAQKDQKTATIAILKSRFGDDGKVFENCTFDNSRMLIDTTTMQSFVGFEENQQQRNSERTRSIATDYRNRYAQQQQH